MTYGDQGEPRLPKFEDQWPYDFIASLLDAFFHAMWRTRVLHCEHGECANISAGVVHHDSNAQVDWVAVACNPSSHLPSSWLTCEIADPMKSSLLKLVILYDKLWTAQDTPDRFYFLPNEPASTNVLPEPTPTNALHEPTLTNALHEHEPVPTNALHEPVPRLGVGKTSKRCSASGALRRSR